MNSGSENVAIIRIRQHDRLDAMLVAFDENAVDMRIHQMTRSFELRAGNIRPIA
jgi:hypothetical protein